MFTDYIHTTCIQVTHQKPRTGYRARPGRLKFILNIAERHNIFSSAIPTMPGPSQIVNLGLLLYKALYPAPKTCHWLDHIFFRLCVSHLQFGTYHMLIHFDQLANYSKTNITDSPSHLRGVFLCDCVFKDGIYSPVIYF